MKKIAGVIVMVLSCWLLVHYGDVQKECVDNPPSYNSSRYFDCRELEAGEGLLVSIGGLVLGGMLFCSHTRRKRA